MSGAVAHFRGLRASEPQPVTFVELFFDLVFVFALTQVTVLVAGDLDAEGVLQGLLIFWLIWWAWTQFTWTLNPADTRRPAVRLITLAATAAAFVMATAVTGAFAGDALWFAVPYVAVRALGLGLQVGVELERPGVEHTGVRRWAALSLVGLGLVVLGAFVDPSLRPLVWLAAIGADLVAAGLAAGSGGQVWDLSPAHLSERHGLFVIIALGESLIVAATGLTEEARTFELVAAAGAALVLTCVMWWSYFGWLKDALEHAVARVAPEQLGSYARDAFSLAHFPLVCGIVGFAVAIKDIVHHPDAPLVPEVLAALGVGVALYAGFSAVSYWRLTRRLLLPRLALLAVMGVALVVVAPLPPVWPLAVAAGSMLVIVVVEALRPEPAGEAHAAAAHHGATEARA